MELNFAETRLSRPVNIKDIEKYINEYVGVEGIGKKIILEPIIKQIARKETEEIINNCDYPMEVVETELNDWIRSCAGVGLILGGFLLAN